MHWAWGIYCGLLGCHFWKTFIGYQPMTTPVILKYHRHRIVIYKHPQTNLTYIYPTISITNMSDNKFSNNIIDINLLSTLFPVLKTELYKVLHIPGSFVNKWKSENCWRTNSKTAKIFLSLKSNKQKGWSSEKLNFVERHIAKKLWSTKGSKGMLNYKKRII